MDVPSVKGSIFQLALDDLKLAIDEGRCEPAELDARLSEKERGILDRPVTAAEWVPIDRYVRVLELLVQLEGGRDPVGYLRRRGARACEKLLGGAYKGYKVEPGAWGRRTGETMIGIGKLLYNFTRWSFRELGDGVYEIGCQEAENFPDCAVETAHGFIESYAAYASGREVEVDLERPARSHFAFTIRIRR
jgi:hypothetical protein